MAEPCIQEVIRSLFCSVSSTLPDESYLGEMNVSCKFCGALKFPEELFKCCHKGKVSLTPLHPYPPELKRSSYIKIPKYNFSMATKLSLLFPIIIKFLSFSPFRSPLEEISGT